MADERTVDWALPVIDAKDVGKPKNVGKRGPSMQEQQYIQHLLETVTKKLPQHRTPSLAEAVLQQKGESSSDVIQVLREVAPELTQKIEPPPQQQQRQQPLQHQPQMEPQIQTINNGSNLQSNHNTPPYTTQSPLPSSTTYYMNTMSIDGTSIDSLEKELLGRDDPWGTVHQNLLNIINFNIMLILILW
eukprot:TRINITY_DN3925_c0_g1_i1.p1 TRINITY_DN3925_c0_g1~~TRINITY_DN3925_c0_g1_i1.p1  ORF type:complete len:189 (-),score=32.02 TRINITY_DN3925_c0_g1_i1:475-1041(-)